MTETAPSEKNYQHHLLLALSFALPVLFMSKLYDVFELPKLFLLKATLLLILFPKLLRAVQKNTLTLFIHPFFVPMTVYLGIFILSTLISPYPFLSSLELINTFSFVLFSYLVFHYSSSADAPSFFLCLTLSTFLVSLYAIMQHLGIDPISWDDPNIRVRSTSTLGNPDFLGAYLAMAFPFALAHAITAKQPTLKVFSALSLFALFIALTFSFSRGAWLCFLTALFVFILFSGKDILRRNVKLFAFLLAGFFVLFYVASHENVTIDKTKTTAAQRIKTTLHMNYPSIAIRRHLWHDTLHMIRAKPWTGFGPGNYTLFFTQYRSPELLNLAGRLSLPESAHNDYLQQAADSGLLEFFAFIWLLACGFLYARKQNNETSHRILNAALLSALAAFFMENIFYYHVASTYLLFFLCLGVLPLFSERDKVKITLSLPFSRPSQLILKITLPLLFIGLFTHILFPVFASYSFRKGTIEMDNHNLTGAALSFSEAKLLAPYDKLYGAYLGKCYEEMALFVSSAKTKKKGDEKRFFTLALKEYEGLLKQYPNHSFVYADRGRVWFVMFQLGVDKTGIKKSIDSYQKAIQLDPKNSILYNDLGRVVLSQMKLKEAESYFQKAVHYEPAYAEAHANLGLCYYQEKKRSEARFQFYRALDADPHYFDALVRLGVMAFEEKKYPEALKYFKDASAARPEDTLLPQKIKELGKLIRRHG